MTYPGIKGPIKMRRGMGEMEWWVKAIVVIGIVACFMPVVYVWYMFVFGGIYAWIKESRKEKEPEKRRNEARADTKSHRAHPRAGHL